MISQRKILSQPHKKSEKVTSYDIEELFKEFRNHNKLIHKTFPIFLVIHLFHEILVVLIGRTNMNMII